MFIYNTEQHALHNHWIALANPESDDFTKVRGFLRLSVSVLHENDDRVELMGNSSDNSQIALPPQIKMKYKQIYIYILKAKGLPDMDYIISPSKTNRECNGFVKVEYMGMKVTTSVKDTKSDLIVWNEVIKLPANSPIVSQIMTFSLWDKDVGSDDIIGSFEVNLKDVFGGLYTQFRYVNIYGAPLGVSGKFTDKMNQNSEIGSLWKGKLMLKFDYEDSEFPKTSTTPLKKDDPVLISAGELRENVFWNFEITLVEGLFLPKTDGKYMVMFCVEGESVEFSAKVKVIFKSESCTKKYQMGIYKELTFIYSKC